MKLSKSEAGKLGAEKTKEYYSNIMISRIENYNQNPSHCYKCNGSLEYKKRKNKFCSHSCSAQFNNINRTDNKKIFYKYCEECSKPIKRGYKRFCSNLCRIEFNKKELIKNVELGLVSDRGALKQYLTEKFGYQCNECSINEWKGFKLSLELDHIDGNAGNNFPQNIRLLCPNCHSITNTWKGKNKGYGRLSRGLPVG